ncbi:hypothetical protein, partial [Acinetobacter baumannii]
TLRVLQGLFFMVQMGIFFASYNLHYPIYFLRCGVVLSYWVVGFLLLFILGLSDLLRLTTFSSHLPSY